MKGIKTQDDLASPNELLKALSKALVERALEGEVTHHLGYEKNDPVGYGWQHAQWEEPKDAQKRARRG